MHANARDDDDDEALLRAAVSTALYYEDDDDDDEECFALDEDRLRLHSTSKRTTATTMTSETSTVTTHFQAGINLIVAKTLQLCSLLYCSAKY